MKASKIRNNLKKGTLHVLYKNIGHVVTKLYTKRVVIKSTDGETHSVDMHEVEFKSIESKTDQDGN